MAARSSDVAQPSPTAVAALCAVDRAAAELRRGGVAMITTGGGGATLVLAAECATPEGLDRLARLDGGTRSLVLTAPRAAALTLVTGYDYLRVGIVHIGRASVEDSAGTVAAKPGPTEGT